MSNPNQTPTYEEARVTSEHAQQAGGVALKGYTSHEHVHEWTALAEPSTLAHWPGFTSQGEPKLSRQARFKARQEAQQ